MAAARDDRDVDVRQQRAQRRADRHRHQVVAIAEDGVSLRLAQEPVIQLDGMRPAAEGHSMGSGKP